MPVIEIMYECHACNSKRKLQVPARETPEKDIKEWMDGTMRLVERDHAFKSLMCEERKADLWIPFDQERHQWIGQYLPPEEKSDGSQQSS